MTEFDHEEEVSPQEAAEYLVDIAYGLTAGQTVELRGPTERMRVPVGDLLVVKRRSTHHGGRVELAIELRWSA
jgi:amphi-Trp domain-containing protein